MELLPPLGQQPIIDLSKIAGVKKVFCSMSGEISIHLSCNEGNEGDEQIVYDNLPKWIHDNMKVVKSTTHVFLKYKKTK